MRAYLSNNLRLCNGTAGNMSVVVFFVRVRPEIKMSRLALVALFAARVADTSQPIMIDMMANGTEDTYERYIFVYYNIYASRYYFNNKQINEYPHISQSHSSALYQWARGCGFSTHTAPASWCWVLCVSSVSFVYILKPK